ncbi:MAG: peptidylprolyl isomerase [bacterium]
MGKAVLIVSAALVLLAALFVGCAKKDSLVVAKVGGEKITWGEFREGYLKSPQYRRAREDSSAKHEYLNSLIQKKLMVQEAYRQGLDKDEEIAKQVESTEKNLILRELYNREILNKMVSESEIRDFYDHSAEEVKARHILIKAPTNASPEARQKARAKIDSLLTLVEQGQDFAQLARENSEDTGSATKGGDLGFFGWGRMVDEFQKVAFALQPGQTSDVVETQYGYHIIRVEEKREAKRGSYSEMRDQIRNQLLGRKKAELQQRVKEYIENLKREKNLAFDEQALALLSEKKREGEFTAENLTDIEKSTVLARHKGGELTLADYLLREAELPPQARARATDTESLKRQIEGMLTSDFLVEKAKDLGLEREQKVRETVRKRREELMVKQFRKNIENSVQITEEQMRSHFEQHREEYVLPEQVNIQEILVKEKTVAESLLKRIKRGADIAPLAKQHSQRKWAAKRGGKFGFFTENQYGPIGKEAFALKVGQFGGPLKVPGGYSVFKVIDRQEPRPQTFEEAKPIMERKLEKELKEAAFEGAMAALKEKASVDINLKVLTMRVAQEQG